MSRSTVKILSNTNLQTSYALWVALTLASIAIWWSALAATLHLALTNDAYTHILLIVPLSLALIYLQWKLTSISLESGFWQGAILLAVGLFLRVIPAWHVTNSSSDVGLSITMLGIVLWWVGSVMLCFGWRAVRSLLFPLGFLLLIVPFSSGMLTAITQFLQDESAYAASLLFRVAQVPVMRNGVFLSIPGLNIEVARECSSIRSSMMLAVITLLLAHLFLRSWWRKALLAMAIVPLAVAKNAVRIFTIAELGTRVDPGFLEGRLHRNGGVLFLALSLIAVVALLWLLRKSEEQGGVQPVSS